MNFFINLYWYFHGLQEKQDNFKTRIKIVYLSKLKAVTFNLNISIHLMVKTQDPEELIFKFCTF